jgi:hypothetical protein
LFGASAVQAQYPYYTYYQPSVSYYAPIASPRISFYGTPAHDYYPTTFPSVSYYPSTAPVITRYRPFAGRTVVRYPYSPPVVYYP